MPVPVPKADVERAKAFYERFVPLLPCLVERDRKRHSDRGDA